ncbi:MAG: hypothetical protein R3B47_18205 [Bacteroidia bacterium]
MLILSAVMIITFLPAYLSRNVGLSETDMQYLLFAAGGIFACRLSAIIGRLTDRFGPMKVFIGLVIGSVVPIWAVTSMPAVGWVLALAAVSSFFIFVLGQLVPELDDYYRAVSPAHRGSFMSLKSGTAVCCLDECFCRRCDHDQPAYQRGGQGRRKPAARKL